MSASVTIGHSGMTFEVARSSIRQVCLFGNIGTYPALIVQMPPDQARKLAADLIASADRIESPSPPDPAAASLPAAGGDFSSELAHDC